MDRSTSPAKPARVNATINLRLFYTDVTTGTRQTDPDLSKVMPLAFETKGAAIDAAVELIARNAVVWKIEGTESQIVSRAEIEAVYTSRTGKRPRG